MIAANRLIAQAKKLFRDTIVIRVQGGKGGPGLPKYGGIGGKGGDVIIQASSRVQNLQSLLKKSPDGLFMAGDGQESRRTRLLGIPGRDLFLKVPVGVTIEDSEKQILGDLNNVDDKVVVALGGQGGDKFSDNHGLRGQYRILRLDFKTISDLVFVGYPNAGKSSLLRAVSNAVPKVAEYPFTTLRPHLGIVNYDDYRKITMADLPGLVEGASKNIGLGHDFLKHIVRAKILVFVIDINNVDLGSSYPKRTPLETLCILNKEIEMYDDTILRKPAILLVSKMDSLANSSEKFEQFKKQLKSLQENFMNESANLPVDKSLIPQNLLQFDAIIPISSVDGFNMRTFTRVARETMDKYAEMEQNFKSYSEIMHQDTNRLRS